MLALLTLLGGGSYALTGAGCGTPAPAPDYPTPQDPAIEDSEFAEILGLDTEDELEAEDDDWVDPGPGEPEGEPTPEAAPETTPEAAE